MYELGVVYRHITRTDAATADALAQYGSATVHEAMGRVGLLKPYMRPIYPGAQVSGNTITLTLKDGGAGDDDLQQNRAIDDPGGPAQVAQVAAAAPASIPTLGEWALALLAGVLGLFSLGALRRRV